jgi:hypothetical protein
MKSSDNNENKIKVIGRLANVARRIPGIYGLRSRIREELAFMRHIVKNGLWKELGKRGLRHGNRLRQMPTTWEASFSLDCEGSSIVSALSKREIQFRESSHTIYVPPQPELSKKLGQFVSVYPSDAGFKILKNIGSPKEVDYVADNRSYFWAGSLVVGKAIDLIPVASLVHHLGIGPRLYDFAGLTAGGANASMFVVKHIEGIEPSELEWRQFMERLAKLIKNHQIGTTTPNWETNDDFAKPHCCHNLVKSLTDSKLYFVDTQNFFIPDYEAHLETIVQDAAKTVHFGHKHILRGGKYLYQQVPGISKAGKRDTEARWARIRSLLAENQIDIKGRVMLDIGCNTGMMLAGALSDGALWGVGWDRPQVIHHAEAIAGALGYTRLDFFPRELGKDSPLPQEIPPHLRLSLDRSIVFYLAIRHHIGFIDALRELPWQALVYEGAQNETGEELKDIISEFKSMVPCDVVHAGQSADGDCVDRPLLLFVRKRHPDPKASDGKGL